MSLLIRKTIRWHATITEELYDEVKKKQYKSNRGVAFFFVYNVPKVHNRRFDENQVNLGTTKISKR